MKQQFTPNYDHEKVAIPTCADLPSQRPRPEWADKASAYSGRFFDITVLLLVQSQLQDGTPSGGGPLSGDDHLSTVLQSPTFPPLNFHRVFLPLHSRQ